MRQQHTPTIVAYIYIKGAAKKFLSHSSLIYVICTSPPLVHMREQLSEIFCASLNRCYDVTPFFHVASSQQTYQDLFFEMYEIFH